MRSFRSSRPSWSRRLFTFAAAVRRIPGLYRALRHEYPISLGVFRALAGTMPEVVVVSADDPARLRASSVVLDLIAEETTLVLGGRAAQEAGSELAGAVLPADVVRAADSLGDLLPRTELVPAR